MTDTTQTIDHAAAIRQEADRLYWMALIQAPDRDQFHTHADALAAERDAAVAKAERLRRYGMLWEDDFREQMQGQHSEYVEVTIQQMRSECLQPGDLDDAAPARDGGAR